MVPAVSAAAIAVGADGLLVEVHNRPEQALSDGVQSLSPAEFELLMNDLEAVSVAVGRR
jgi:3-deoxy-7-phosphoheptulonate synthase